MRHLLSVLVAVTVVMFVTPASAGVDVNISESINQTVSVPCANGGAGEDVVLTGDLHVLLTSTVNNNSYSVKVHYQPQGVAGVGQITGDRYRATGVTQEHFSGHFDGEQASDTFVNNFRIIGPGGSSLLIHAIGHFTINANGEVTVDFSHSTEACR